MGQPGIASMRTTGDRTVSFSPLSRGGVHPHNLTIQGVLCARLLALRMDLRSIYSILHMNGKS
jgi:hypothetical protein